MPLYINSKSKSSYLTRRVVEWDIDKIEAELKAKKLPENLRLNSAEMINNLTKFIERHVNYARHNNGNATFRIYFHRLVIVNDLLDKI